MAFSGKLSSLRKSAGLSQERLADKLGVSRQAITKWETGSGEPTLENLRAVATLFGVSFDDLLGDGSIANEKAAFYESLTEYDVDAAKHFDIHAGGAKSVCLRAVEGEKLRVRLFSDSIADLQNDFKIKLDDIKNRIDIDLRQKGTASLTLSKRALNIEIEIPQKYLSKLELATHTAELALFSIDCPSIELDGRISALSVERVHGRIEVQENLDMQISLREFSGSFELNQLFATSRLCVQKDFAFRARKRGIANAICYEENGAGAEDFSDTGAENCIELNGIKSELVIARE